MCIYHCIRENVNEGKEGRKEEKRKQGKKTIHVSVGKEKKTG